MRIFRLIATPILLLGLLALLVWGATWGWRELTAPLPSPSPTPCVITSAAVVTPVDVTVRVFNGGFTSGLAGRVRTDLERAGFVVIRVDNTDERVVGTMIRANERESAQIQLISSYFVEPQVDYDTRVDGTVDVLVGTDFAGMAEAPLAQVETPDGQVCRVPSPSPTVPVSPSPTPPAPSPTP